MPYNATLRRQQAMRHAWNRAAREVFYRAGLIVLLCFVGIETICLLCRL